MLREILKSKIHKARVTGKNLDYVGSITIDEALMDAAGLIHYEKVLVSNIRNGERFDTYVIPGKKNSGVVEVNGAAAHLAEEGDELIIMGFASLNEKEAEKHKPKIIVVDGENRISK